MALGNPAVGGSKGDIKTSAKHVVAEMEDSRTGVRFPPPPPIIVPTPSSQVSFPLLIQSIPVYSVRHVPMPSISSRPYLGATLGATEELGTELPPHAAD